VRSVPITRPFEMQKMSGSENSTVFVKLVSAMLGSSYQVVYVVDLGYLAFKRRTQECTSQLCSWVVHVKPV